MDEEHPFSSSLTTQKQVSSASEPASQHEDLLYCVACGLAITFISARIEVLGQHRHCFVNPHGYDYVIGCFRDAFGCLIQGQPSPFFSWFPGMRWQVAVCSQCQIHLGWSFGQPIEFYGFILERLVSRGPTSSHFDNIAH